MPTYANHDDFVEHTRRFGHPAGPMPEAIQEAYRVAGLVPPPTLNLQLGVITPPSAESGFCVHCGEPADNQDNVREHVVEGFENAQHPQTGEPMRMLVIHCDDHIDSDHCSTETPGGHCLPVTQQETA